MAIEDEFQPFVRFVQLLVQIQKAFVVRPVLLFHCRPTIGQGSFAVTIQRGFLQLAHLSPAQIIARADEGLSKQWVVHQALALRRRHPEWFRPDAAYTPLRANGERAAHAVAYQRGAGALVLVPRLVLGLADDWRDTRLPLPPGNWHNRLSGETLEGGERPVAEILGAFPVALLEREEPMP